MFGWDDAINAGLKIIDKFIPDTNARMAAQEELTKTMMQAANKAESDQRDINKVEASSASFFVAGWRPGAGWLCVTALAYDWLVSPMITWFLAFRHITDIALPQLSSAQSEALLYALLGIGGFRTIDKVTGNDTKGIVGVVKNAVKTVTGKKL